VLAGGAAVFLLAYGAGAGDAVASAASVLRYACGLAVGGTIFSVAAMRLLDRDAGWKDLFGPACGAAAWSPIVFVVLLWIFARAGMGPTAALYAGLLLLFWGVVAGMGIIGGNEGGEPGRLLVAACLGVTGSLAGLAVAHQIPPPVAVMALPAPFDDGTVRRGNFLLVRRTPDPHAPAMVLLRETGTREAIFAVIEKNGKRRPLGDTSATPKMLQDWNVAGRVFFQLGIQGGIGVVSAEQTLKLSH
jgi:hypothetical protein